VIVANRLHAVIVAHAHGIPTVALEWDPKVRAFMDKTGRAAFSLPPGHQQRATILARALEAHTTGVSPAAIETMRAQALTDIAALVSALAPGRALRA
jgi:polysaccharide pyruvyl transferase WcaK-like protein